MPVNTSVDCDMPGLLYLLPAGGIEGQGPYVPVAQLPGMDPLGVGGPLMAPRGGRGPRPPGNHEALGCWVQ